MGRHRWLNAFNIDSKLEHILHFVYRKQCDLHYIFIGSYWNVHIFRSWFYFSRVKQQSRPSWFVFSELCIKNSAHNTSQHRQIFEFWMLSDWLLVHHFVATILLLYVIEILSFSTYIVALLHSKCGENVAL